MLYRREAATLDIPFSVSELSLASEVFVRLGRARNVFGPARSLFHAILHNL